MLMRSLPPGWRTTVVHVVIPVALTFLLFISATMLFAVPMLRETMMTSKRETARELTGTVCALLQDYEHRIQAGELTKEEAQQRAIARVHELRYGPEDKDYFWINDQTPTMIMHPYRSDLDGKDISGFADPHGKHLFKEMVARVKESSTGEGYVDYMWQWKDDPNRIVPKVSHVRLFKPWGWIVGTGIYIEDVNNTISAVIRRLLYANLAILAVVGVLSAYLILQGFRRERERLAAQEALKDSEQRLSDIIDFLPDATLVLNSDGTVIAWNRAIEIMTDVPAAEMLGRSDYHYAVPFYGQPRPLLCDIFLKGLESWDKGYNFLSREENQVSAETFVPTLGGQGRYLLVSASPLYDGSGTLVGAIESIRDITVRKKAESNSARLTEILETTSDIVSTALPNGKITYMNRAGRRVLGLPEQGEVGMVENIHPAWAAGLIESEGIPYTLAHGLWRGETAILGADGTEIPTSQVIMAHRDSDGELIYLSTILRDISHIKEAEAEKTRLRNLLGNIIDSMPSVIVGVDPSACVTQWNQQAQEATGISGEEAQGRRIDSVFPDLAQQMQRVQEALRTKQTQYEGKVRREGEGEVQFSDITVYPLVANGTEGAVIRIDDVTQRVRIEEIMIQSEKMMSVGGLAAGMAHEINNPLAGIMQSVQVVQNRLDLAMKRNREAADECGVAMEKIREYMDKRGILQMLDSVLKSGQRAAGIVDNMLSFSRKSESKFAPHDMAALLDRTVWLAESDYNLKRHYDFRKIDIVRMYDPNTPQVPCEATKLQQVFLNILKNGAEAMAEKAGTLREQTDSEGSPAGGSYQPQFTLAVAPDGPMVRIEITDNGPGMPESARKRIFEPFFTTKSVGAGTGLGLSVSFFIIVENHGGQMTVESAPGESTKFIIKLPSVQEA